LPIILPSKLLNFLKMKKLFTLLVICFIANFSLSAQYKYFVGGQLGFRSNDAQSYFSVLPNVGYILNDHMILVGEVGFSSTTDKNTVKDIKSNTFDLGVALRYGWKAGDNAFVFLAPGVNISNGKVADVKNSAFGVNIRPGVSYQLAPRWSMTAHYGSLGYDSVKLGDGDAVGTFGLDLDMNTLDFGLNFHF
jgi:hypothetical protein